MTIDEFKRTAFAKYLATVLPTKEHAAAHLLECLHNDVGGDSMAWDLMALAHGRRWRMPPDKLPLACLQAIEYLKTEMSDATS